MFNSFISRFVYYTFRLLPFLFVAYQMIRWWDERSLYIYLYIYA